MKFCLTIDKHGIIREHKIFKGFSDSKRLLDRSQYFKTIEGKKVSVLLPKSWKKSVNSGIDIPTKMRFCKECNDKTMCIKCNLIVNENKEFKANLSLLKRQHPNQFGHMLPCFKE